MQPSHANTLCSAHVSHRGVLTTLNNFDSGIIILFEMNCEKLVCTLHTIRIGYEPLTSGGVFTPLPLLVT
jgi:hypothetical protein